MYVDRSFKTKKALKEAVAEGAELRVYQPGGMFASNAPANGTCSVEGPNNVMHTWYATVTLKDGVIIQVK